MNPTTALIALALLGYAGTGVAQSPGKMEPQPIKELRLQAFFHTTEPWVVRIYPPETDSSIPGNNSLRVCFVVSQMPDQSTDCQAIAADAETQLDNVTLETLAGPQPGSEHPALVIRATHSAGSVTSTFHDTYVWTFLRFDNKKAVPAGTFYQAFHYSGFFGSKQQFIRTGPLAGTFVSVWQPFTPEAPVRYRMEVYAPSHDGYTLVLSLLSANRYPSINMGGEPADPIATLMPEMERAMRLVYDGKVPHIAN